MKTSIRATAVCAAAFAFGAWVVPMRGDETRQDVLEVAIGRPAGDATLADVNDDKYSLELTIKNISRKDVVVWPFAEVQVFDRDGTPMPCSTSIGRFGGRAGGPLLESLPLEKLEPGESYRIEISLGNYRHEEKAMTGWTLPAAGEYAVVIRYRYDRARVKKEYAENMAPKKLNDERMPWNRAIEIDRTISVPLVVK